MVRSTTKPFYVHKSRKSDISTISLTDLITDKADLVHLVDMTRFELVWARVTHGLLELASRLEVHVLRQPLLPVKLTLFSMPALGQSRRYNF